jgi:hypothetical protein
MVVYRFERGPDGLPTIIRIVKPDTNVSEGDHTPDWRGQWGANPTTLMSSRHG